MAETRKELWISQRPSNFDPGAAEVAQDRPLRHHRSTHVERRAIHPPSLLRQGTPRGGESGLPGPGRWGGGFGEYHSWCAGEGPQAQPEERSMLWAWHVLEVCCFFFAEIHIYAIKAGWGWLKMVWCPKKRMWSIAPVVLLVKPKIMYPRNGHNGSSLKAPWIHRFL